MCLVKCEISLPCSMSKKKHSLFRVFGINTDLRYFKTPQISIAAAARDILGNFEISLAIFILFHSHSDREFNFSHTILNKISFLIVFQKLTNHSGLQLRHIKIYLVSNILPLSGGPVFLFLKRPRLRRVGDEAVFCC